MAIVWTMAGVTAGLQAYEGATRSGWRVVTPTNSGFTGGWIFARQAQVLYPAALTRPGNLGTAYTGVWTGNRDSAALDNHIPIRFKRVNSLVAELRRVVRNQLLRT